MVSVASRIGAASSPFVVQMTRIHAVLPFALMGGLSFIAAVLCWVLPETLGKHTAEIMEDTEKQEGIVLIRPLNNRQTSHVLNEQGTRYECLK